MYTQDGHTALYYACMRGDVEAVQSLLDYGASIDLQGKVNVHVHVSGRSRILEMVVLQRHRRTKRAPNFCGHGHLRLNSTTHIKHALLSSKNK